MTTSTVQIIGIDGIAEVMPGDDVSMLIWEASRQLPLLPSDVVIITHKIVSKAEGQLVDLATVIPSALATAWATTWEKDARQIEVCLREAKRIVRMDRGVLIAETHHGFICANAGVDASNVPGDDVVCLLPRDPDGSARRIAEALSAMAGFAVPVIITDSFGRAWRNGIMNIAIGVHGLLPLADYRGQPDMNGREMKVSVLAVADELASAAELVSGKVDRRPVAIVRGYAWEAGQGRAADLVMDPTRDLFH